MIIFGYYTVPLKTVYAEELPEALSIPPETSFQYGIKLAHIMFIPVFPLEKKWLLQQEYGDAYEVTPDAVRFLNETYGTKGTPLYAFSFWVLAFLGLLGYLINQEINDHKREVKKEKQTQQVAAYQAQERSKYDNPTLNDYYVLKSDKGKYYGAKVDSVTSEQVWLRFVANEAGYSQFSKPTILRKFVLKRDSFLVYSVPRKVLKKSFQSKTGLFRIKDIDKQSFLKVIDMYQVDVETNLGFGLQDAPTEAEVKNKLKNFINQSAIDASLAYLDDESRQYFLEIIRVARNEGVPRMKEMTQTSTYPPVTYALLMYAKYGYLLNAGKKVSSNEKDLLRGFSQLAKKAAVGLWSSEANLKSLLIKNVRLVARNKVKVNVVLNANLVAQTRPINFDLEMRRVEGEWKLNLLSTFAYTQKQIVLLNGRAQMYRKSIREDLKRLSFDVTFAPELIY